MADIYLRGKLPLTMYRGANGTAGGYLYRGSVIEEHRVDHDDAERLIGEGFLEKVVRAGEGFKLADDTDTGRKGDSVAVGDTSAVPDSELAKDPGPVNGEQQSAAAEATANADRETEARRAAARAKLPADGSLPDGRASKDVWVEWLAGRGYAYDELVKQEPAELKALAKNA
jgi:hypothetical protein